MSISATPRRHPADEAHPLEFAAHEFMALLSGALYWPVESTLLVADLHLEKMSSYAPAGQFLPPYDTGATLEYLSADLAFTGAGRVACLGDSFHRDEGPSTLLDRDRAALVQLMTGRDWTWIAGNHDPAPHGLGGECRDALEVDGLRLSHEPDPKRTRQIAGHLHPAARVKLNGRSTRRPCFAWDDARLILPAYGVATGSLNVLGPGFAGLFTLHRLNVLMLGRDRLYPVARRHLVDG
ncbi:MAG: ligase-associated DNA damage response endonuclease PdeM [Cucumibacter sp.]